MAILPHRILVTGGTGSFGTAFAHHILDTHPDISISIFSRSEYPQILLRRTLACYGSRARFFLGDVRDLPRLRQACAGHDAVVHAAALKHIAIGEEAPSEVIQTNILGTQNVLQACADTGVATCVVLSSDKAVAPENLYGATKMAAERLTLTASRAYPDTRCNLVRYGNVMDSRGAVLETWEHMLAQGNTCLPVTDLDMTRFFMTLADAVSLVILAMAAPVSGYIFVPNLPSCSLRTLAQALMGTDKLLAGIDYEILGSQPGEKMHETLLTTAEQQRTVMHRDALVSGECYAVYPSWLTVGAAEHALQEWRACPWMVPYTSEHAARQLSSADVSFRLHRLTTIHETTPFVREAPHYVSNAI